MPLTDKEIDLVVGGIIGVSGTLIGSLCKAVGSRFWAWWDHRQKIKKGLRHYRILIGNAR